MKYVDSIIGFDEFPDEISLCINISGCPNHCIECHSAYLADDIGTDLTPDSLKALIDGTNNGITCIGLMGGDQDPAYINKLAKFVKDTYPNLKVGWYSGKQILASEINLDNFDFYKVGPYKKEYGPLNKPSTNQVYFSKGKHLHKIDADPEGWYDITDKF